MTYGDGSDVPDFVDGKPNPAVYVDTYGHRHTGVMASMMRQQDGMNRKQDSIQRQTGPRMVSAAGKALTMDEIATDESTTFIKVNEIPWSKIGIPEHDGHFESAEAFIEFREEEE